MILYILFVAVIAAVAITVGVVAKETFASEDADAIEKTAVAIFSSFLLVVVGGFCLLLLYYCAKVGLEIF